MVVGVVVVGVVVVLELKLTLGGYELSSIQNWVEIHSQSNLH